MSSAHLDRSIVLVGVRGSRSDEMSIGFNFLIVEGDLVDEMHLLAKRHRVVGRQETRRDDVQDR
jgi:hypothetical protein